MLTNETAMRATCDAFFGAVAGRVAGADLCFERSTRAEVERDLDGGTRVTAHASRGGLVARLWDAQGRCLEVGLGEPGPMDVKLRVEEALEALAPLAPDPEFALADLPNRANRHFGSDSVPSPAEQRAPERIAVLVGALEAMVGAASSPAAVLQLRARVYTEVEEKVVCDDRGLWRTQSIASSFLQVEVQARGEATRGRWVERVGDVATLDVLCGPGGKPTPRVEAAASKAIARAVRMLEARTLTEAERAALTHVIVDASAMVFVHEACGHNFEADIVLAGHSGLFHASGAPVSERVGSAAVRLVDGPLDPNDGTPRGFGTHFIDDEGVEVETVVLIDAGRPVDCMHSRETAGRLGRQSNGHGFSDIGQPRLVRMTNTSLVAAAPQFQQDDLQAFLSGIALGLWVEGSNGGEVTGDGMSASFQSGRLVREGRLTDEWIRPGMLTVRTRGALLGVEAFHGPPRIDRLGFCGKGQTKTVSEGGSTARIRLSEDFVVGC